ncbi:putative phage related protein [Escherichia coli]|nr:putative phage related protein [Escherichia coli]
MRADKAEGEAEYQGKVIANQALNFNRFNQIAENASRLNSLVDIGHEKTVIKYREVLLREKNCDFPVPVDIAVGLLNYANRLRASALHADSGTLTQPVIVPLPPER